VSKKSTPTVKQYLPDEVAVMHEQGYITPREAQELTGVTMAMVYRAMKPRLKKNTKGNLIQLPPPVKVKIGENAWSRYIEKAGWLAYVKARREDAAKRLGMVAGRGR
jgi:predicted DNA-binding transcriptional regulator AlpA